MGIAGNGYVEPAQAVAPRVGLIASAREIKRLEENVNTPGTRWETGFAWAPEDQCSADGSGVLDPCDNTTAKTENDPLPIVKYDPVALWASDRCSTLTGLRDRIGRARRRLVACQSKLLAQEFWNGTLAIAKGFPNAYLGNAAAANTLTNGPVSEVSALACLEEGLAECSCGTGMIHVTPALMTRWKSMQVIERFGNTFRTANDTIVVADAGYTGEGPGGTPPASGSVWAYATDLVQVRLGPIDIWPKTDLSAEGMGRSSTAYTNTLTYRAERLAAATFDGCCHLAVEVDIPICADLAAS